jgi:hypothetical protein
MEVSKEKLIDQLAGNLAKLITNQLEASEISAPLVMVDLFYHYADWYFPLVSYLTIDDLV